MPAIVSCPKCNSQKTKSIPEMEKTLCLTCAHLFGVTNEQENQKLKVFLSFGHDVFAKDAFAIKADLEGRGHTVWYDVELLQAGCDFEHYIEKGLKWCDLIVLLMTPHSIRREPAAGYCLNEIAKALGFNKRIIPVYLVFVEEGPPHFHLPFRLCRYA